MDLSFFGGIGLGYLRKFLIEFEIIWMVRF